MQASFGMFELGQKQAFTNCVHGYDRTRNRQVKDITCARKSCTVLIKNTMENYLLPAHTDHYYALKVHKWRIENLSISLPSYENNMW